MEQPMLPFLILELVLLPLYAYSFIIFQRHGQLTENRFGLLVVTYLSLIVYTLFEVVSTTTGFRILGRALALLCWFPGYSIARWFYRRFLFPDKPPSD